LEVQLRQSDTVLDPQIPWSGLHLLWVTACCPTIQKQAATSFTLLWMKSCWVDSKNKPLVLTHAWPNFATACIKAGDKAFLFPLQLEDIILLEVIYL